MSSASRRRSRISARINAEIDKLLTDMAEADRRIAKYQEETARLKAETRVMIAALGTR